MQRTPAHPAPWHPTADELTRILDEMRPIVAEFSRRSVMFLASLTTTDSTASDVDGFATALPGAA